MPERPDLHHLARTLAALEGRGYPAYKAIAGAYAAPGFTLHIDHVQGDPFAEPSRVRVTVPPATAALPPWAYATPARRTATADFLLRALAAALERRATRTGTGHSGELRILRPGPEVLDRTATRVAADGAVEARLRVGLPADGRRILGREAARLLTRVLPEAVHAALRFPALDAAALQRHVETVEDARALRAALEPHGLVAFVADGARLPRRSGVDQAPLEGSAVVPFRSPGSLRVVLQAPNAGAVPGMGIPRGITLIVGGGYHGKSTLLRAIERGVYDHVPGDGRERVVTVPGAVKVRAEDGRHIAGTDISAFIGALPGGADTARFVTDNASGSTSQAAAIAEALELGATCLLLDEDTSATNFLIRDARMQALVPAQHEPITPYIDTARTLARDAGVSTILVLGGSGDYLDVADTVIGMRAYVPADLTAEARAVAGRFPTGRTPAGRPWSPPRPRRPLPDSLAPGRGRRARNIRAWSEDRVLFGEEEVDLSAVEQLVEVAQARAIAHALAWARGRTIDGRATCPEALGVIIDVLERNGLDAFQDELTGELAAFRIFELGAFLNRIRSLRTA